MIMTSEEIAERYSGNAVLRAALKELGGAPSRSVVLCTPALLDHAFRGGTWLEFMAVRVRCLQ
jgi:hypothetical protein